MNILMVNCENFTCVNKGNKWQQPAHIEMVVTAVNVTNAQEILETLSEDGEIVKYFRTRHEELNTLVEWVDGNKE